MSIAEQTAYRLYESYQLGELSYDVKCHLVHLFFPHKASKNENGVLGDEENLRHRAIDAYIDAVEGKSSSAEEMEARLEYKYPWLCE